MIIMRYTMALLFVVISELCSQSFLTTVFQMDPCLLLSSGVRRTYELVTNVLPEKSHWAPTPARQADEKTRYNNSGQSICDWKGRNLVSQRFPLVNWSQVAFSQSYFSLWQISWNRALLQYVMLFSSQHNQIKIKLLKHMVVSAFRSSAPQRPCKTCRTRHLLNKYWVKQWTLFDCNSSKHC